MEAITTFQGNLKSLDEKSYKQLRHKILNQGFSFPLFIWHSDGNNFLLDGHQRLRVLERLKGEEGLEIPEIPVVYIAAANYREAKEKLLSAASQFGQIEGQGLYEFLNDNSMEPDFILENYKLPSFDFDHFMAEYFDPAKPETGITSENEDDVPEIKDKDTVKPGQIFSLGGLHRLMCGDSTNAEHVAILMGNARFNLLLTDPPYNVDYQGKVGSERDGIENDAMDNAKFVDFLSKAFKNAHQYQLEGGSYYIFHAYVYSAEFVAAMRNAQYELRQVLIWLKDSIVFGRQDYQWKHEPILYGWKDGAAHSWYSDRKQTTILEFDRPKKSKEHPTMKPVAILEYLIGNSTKQGDSILDLFGGSGSSIIAAHKTGRQAFAMELDPHYCAVIIKRFKEATGLPVTAIQ